MSVVDPRADLALSRGYHSPQLDVDVRLNTNESPWPPPDDWIDALVDALRNVDWHRYPDREAIELRRAVGARHGRGPEFVFAANGSNEVLQALYLAYGGPDRTVVVFEPTYALHSHIARVTATGVATVERAEDFTLEPAAAASAVIEHQPAIVLLCSPNNPTGRAEPPSVVDAVLAACVETGALLVVDEAYGEFAPTSALERVSPDRPLVVTRTYSKTWSMASARLGYAVAPPAVVEDLQKVTLPYHLDAVTQAAGRLALDFEAEMDHRVSSVTAERERVVDALGDLAVQWWPADANFVLFRPTGRPGAEVWQALVDRSVLVRDCSSWPRLEGCLRVTIGTPEENDAFLAALKEALA